MKTSVIWKISKQNLQEIVNTSSSYAEILRKLQLHPGNTTSNLKKRLEDDNIKYDHLKNGRGVFWNKGIQFKTREDVLMSLIKNSKTARSLIKKYIIRFNLLIHDTCQLCNCKQIWNDKPLVLILDHINGIRNDNRLENLRFICPNCNSQLDTTKTCNKNKRIKINSRKIEADLKSGKSLRQCLLDIGLSDGTNYKTLVNSILK